MRGALGPVMNVTLVTYNIRFGMGFDGCVDLERIADAVRGADVITLQEVERFWKRSAMSDQTALLAGHLCEYHWVYFPATTSTHRSVPPKGTCAIGVVSSGR